MCARFTQAEAERIKANSRRSDVPGHLFITVDTKNRSKLRRSEIFIVGDP